jgi:hypothetical protein
MIGKRHVIIVVSMDSTDVSCDSSFSRLEAYLNHANSIAHIAILKSMHEKREENELEVV